MRKLIKFVECKTTPGLQLWIPGSTIFYRCSCKQELSYDTPGVKTHWDKYEIRVSYPRIKDYGAWKAWLSNIKEKVETNKELYRVLDWSE